MILSKQKAKELSGEDLEAKSKITTKTIILFVALFMIAAFFLYVYNVEGDGWRHFVLFCTLTTAAGLVSLFGELYILKREMRARVE